MQRKNQECHLNVLQSLIFKLNTAGTITELSITSRIQNQEEGEVGQIQSYVCFLKLGAPTCPPNKPRKGAKYPGAHVERAVVDRVHQIYENRANIELI